jgi:alpha-galactosidase
MNRWGLGAAVFSALSAMILLWGRTNPHPAVRADQAYSSNIQDEAKRSPIDFTPDASLSEEIWSKTEWVEFDHHLSGRSEHPGALTRVAAAWTDDSIYFAFRCRYDSLNVYEGEDVSKERWELWNRDVAEVFLNPQPERISHYYEFEVAPNNQWIDLEIDKNKEPFNDSSWNSGFQHATRVDEKNHTWIAELRIPLRSLNVQTIQPGTAWRVNYFRAAGHGADRQRTFLAWSTIPEGQTFHVPSRFGLLRFVR